MFKTTASQCLTYLCIAPDASWCPFFKPFSLITSFTFRQAAWSPWTTQWSNLPTSPWWGCLAWRLPSEGLDPRWHQGSLPRFPKEPVCQTGCSSPNLGCTACSVGEPGRRNRKTKEIHCFVLFHRFPKYSDILYSFYYAMKLEDSTWVRFTIWTLGLNVWIALLGPLVGLHLWINHQWPPPRVVQDDRIVNGQGIVRQVVDDPLPDLHFIADTLPQCWQESFRHSI